VALAHTGALVGSGRAFSAVLSAYGVVEVGDFTELVEMLEVFGRGRRPRGTRIGAVSESGGEAALFADHAEAAGIPFAPLPDELAAALTAEFPNFTAPGNPLDAWAVDEPDRVYPRSLELMAGPGVFDVLVAQVDDSRYRADTGQDWCGPAIRALADATEGTDVFPAVATVHAVDLPPETLALAQERDLAILRGLGNAARALAAAARWAPARPPRDEHRAATALPGDGALPELESTELVARYGVPVAPARRASTPEEAARAAEELGFPVVVKMDGVAHKAAADGVLLGVRTAEEAAEAARRLGGRVLVARQLDPGPEAICGMTRDPDFGPILAVGRGGTDVEARAPGAVRLAPVDENGARDLVAAAGLPDPEGGLARTLVALGRIAFEHPEIAELDVNPLILSGGRWVAVDALAIVRVS
jgi:acyl-CoA synthetase (NDP forming)